jgi:F-type H+/Na+-transporting ATPase subunit alpha
VLKQKTAATWSMEEQVATIFAVGQGLMDDVPVEDIKRFESEMIEHLRASGSASLKAIQESKALDDDTAKSLKDEIEDFKRNQWKGTEADDSPAKLQEQAKEEGETSDVPPTAAAEPAAH